MRISDWSSDVCSSDLNSLHPAMSVYRLGGGRERRANIEDPSRAVVMAFSRRCGVGEIRQLITQRRLRNRVIERSVIRRSDERRVGNGGVSTCRSRGSPYHYKKTQNKTT